MGTVAKYVVGTLGLQVGVSRSSSNVQLMPLLRCDACWRALHGSLNHSPRNGLWLVTSDFSALGQSVIRYGFSEGIAKGSRFQD